MIRSSWRACGYFKGPLKRLSGALNMCERGKLTLLMPPPPSSAGFAGLAMLSMVSIYPLPPIPWPVVAAAAMAGVEGATAVAIL